MQPTALADNYHHTLFRTAVQSAWAQESHVLTAGEGALIQRYLSLPPAAGALYSRLYSRSGTIFRVDRACYASVPQPLAAADTLCSQGLARPRGQLSNAQLLAAHTVAELRNCADDAGVSRAGSRSQLVARLSQADVRLHLPGQCIQIRHAGLFGRLLRIFSGSHRTDLTPLVLDHIGVRRCATYTSTGGRSLFPSRSSLHAYERALKTLTQERSECQWAQTAAPLIQTLTSTQESRVARPPFSPRHLYARAARRAVRAVERQEGPQAALPLYRILMDCDSAHMKPLAVRAAMCLGRIGQSAQGAQTCRDARGAGPASAEDLALERTGRRLARASDQPWHTSSRLQTAPTRVWPMPMTSRHPPRFLSPDGPLPVEGAVVSALTHQGHRALHGESAPWTTLFGVLFRDAIFAPVPDMLPSPLMRGPLDLRSAGFYAPRRGIVDGIVGVLGAGGADDLFSRNFERHRGESIAGVHWDLLPLNLWAQLLHSVGPAVLQSLMLHIVQDPSRAWSGMPDLLILPNGKCDLHEHPLLVELKAPGDSLRDNQRCRHHSLLAAGIPVEVWKVVDEASC